MQSGGPPRVNDAGAFGRLAGGRSEALRFASMSTPEAIGRSHPRQYYETLVEASPTAIVACDPELIVMSWNPAAERLFGYRQAEALGRHVDELVGDHESIRAEAEAISLRVLAEPIQLVTRRSRKDGSLVDVVLRSVPIVIDDELVGAFAMFEDVGELVRQRRFFESLVEMSPAAVIMVDEHVTVSLWNPGAERLFGYTAAEAIGANLDDLIAKDPEIHAEATAWSSEAWEGDAFRRIGRRTRKDGSLVDVEIVAVRVLLEGAPIGFYIIYHDITELEQTRRRLETRIDEQMAELVRTGELARFLPNQVAEGSARRTPPGGGAAPAPEDHGVVRRHGGFHRSVGEPGTGGAGRGVERLPTGDDGSGPGATEARWTTSSGTA